MEALKSFISLYLNWKSAEVLFNSVPVFNFLKSGVCLGGAPMNTRRSKENAPIQRIQPQPALEGARVTDTLMPGRQPQRS